MAVSFVLPGPLTADAGGQAQVVLRSGAATVGEALEALFALHPRLRDRLLTERGEVRPHVNVFVDGESTRFSAGLATPVGDHSEIVVLPAVSGGSRIGAEAGALG